MIDDSALLHGGVYDPVKAREYYLRTRKLKGRRPGAGEDLTGSRPRSGGTSNTVLRNSRREQLLAQQKALDARLERLREVLRELVDAAQKRSGVKEKPENDKSSSAKDKGSKKESKSKDKPLTEAEKRDKREASRKQYAEENRTSLAVDVKHLQAQVQDIRAKIEKAQAEARRKSSQSKKQTASNRR